MAKPSEPGANALAGLLGLSNHTVRKSHYPELAARLDELETERKRYSWLFEHAVHGIFQASLDDGLRAANPALARMLGYADPQAVLFSRRDLASHLFVGGQAELQDIAQVLQREQALLGYETQLRRKDGSSIDVLMNLLLRPDEEGVVEGFVADITERKLAQERLQQLNDELEQRVAERTRQLMEARDAAQAANRSKDKYLAAASHDLLQPLNAARLLISTLRERQLPQAEQLLVERAHQALEGAEDLLSDLLDISRLDQAAIKPDLDLYLLDDVLAPLASEFQPVAAAEGLGLRLRSGRQVIRTDVRLLTRILRNFLSNACRYTEQGRILLGARRRGDCLRLEVWDTGRGIAAQRLQSIFLEFNQLDVGRAADRKGVGLGLAIVERIARILDYPVRVRSWPGRGSVFSIDVPLSTERRCPPVLAPAPLPSVGDPLPGRRLLVLDNELSILQSMAALLAQWGCEVLTATDRKTAFQVLQGRAPELVLADFHLDHGVTGCEVVRDLREHFAVTIPAVMITADRSDQSRRAMQRLGAPLLNKPVKPGKLRAVLSQLLGEAGVR
ncbi:response regulator [Pseudomonas sp. B21-036]|uniref:hybrid sensor histidine kinase/response regulator n=1 Tax=unclassified Pseudomonas TaxID=196821 RepID=UPI0009989C1F|nr:MULTISPECIES: NahK/ErcS family hybrid sensor histidine kinase/response regulator [unclassified Pseudomonas]MDD1958042.1 ATP-binding protein [Pseudomonas sp. 8209]OOW02742.1 hybrid sensor histidine kinase/response regulator [Pseudomonas sp. MF6396]UVL53082.1 response regulator [Pseudomonas sp. B21-036]